MPTDEMLIRMYNLCRLDEDCERGNGHADECGLKSLNCPHPGACACDGE